MQECSEARRGLTFTCSHIGRTVEKDLGHLADLIKRHRWCPPSCSPARSLQLRLVLQTTSGSANTLRFTNLLSRLLDQVRMHTSYRHNQAKSSVQPVLNRKHASLQFLHSLASTPAPTPVTSSFLPSLAPPPLSRTSSKATTPIEPRLPPKGPKGKSRADLLREYRVSIGLSSPSGPTCGY